MGRPKNSEDTKPLTTRLTTSQREAFDEYMRREQAKMPRGVTLAEAAVLRGMVLRCLDLEGIPYIGAQQSLFTSPRAPVVEEPAPPPPPPVVEEPAPPPPPPVVEEPAPPPPPPVVEEPSPPSSPAEVMSEATTAITLSAEPVKTAAKAKKGATATSTKSAPAKKAKPMSTAPAKAKTPPPRAAKSAPAKKAKPTSTAPAKKAKKGAR